MNFSHQTTWDYFEEVLQLKLSAKESWNKLIDHLQNIAPKPYWDQIKNTDIAKEQVEIKDWIEELVSKHPLPYSVVALWIGIVKLWDSDAEIEEYAIYLTGSNSYEVGDAEWAVDADYSPDNRYIIIEGMTEIDQIIQGDESDYSFLDWILPLAYNAFCLDESFRNQQLGVNLLLNNQEKLYTCTGHDSGDYIMLSPIKRF